ncbi:S8 family serine peptidase [Stackebrandtia soli]|uniref:S8 family serine peptidase n=1 Tax=Stackebrandtia soli TaxID=1892856 RepID=UPI0039ED3C55
MRILRAAVALGLGCAAVVALPQQAVADETRDSQWYLETLGIAEAHEISTGKGVTIGLIDSGVDATHPDLKDAVSAGIPLGKSDDPLVDIRDHGTGIASILVGRGHGDGSGVLGIAPDANIISVAIGWDQNSAGNVDDWTAEGIRYLVDQGVDVISVSTTTSGNTAGQEAVNYAKEHGIPVVAAAGNKDNATETMGTEFPGAYKDAIPVSGTTKDGLDWEKSADLSPASEYLAVSAPAEDLPSAKAGGGYFTNSGTSGAAPIVAGTFALVKSVYPDLDWTDLVNRVLGNVDDAGPPGIDEDFGLGVINPVKALTAEVPGQEMKEPGSEEKPDEVDPSADAPDAADGSIVSGVDNTLLISVIAVAGVVLLAVIVVVVRVRDKKKRAAAMREGASAPTSGPPGAPMSGPPGSPMSGPPSSGPPNYAPPGSGQAPQQWQPPQQTPPGGSPMQPPPQAPPPGNPPRQ